MRKLLLLLWTVSVFSSLLAENDPNQWLANQTVSFTENKGQIADKGNIRKDILFMAQGKGVKIYFTRKGIIYNYIQTEETFLKKPKTEAEKAKIRKEHPEQIQHKSKSYGMELLFVGAAENMEVKSEEETGETSNYYLPHCPDGIIGVKSYKKITYKNIYPNIDLVFYGNEQGMKYDFIVKPGGDVNHIQLRYKDVQDLKLLKDGSLEIKNPLGKLIESKPFTYQNNKQEVKSNYQLRGRTVSFQVDNYDKTKNLIIDPSIVWATYYGGSGEDSGNAVTTDKDGNVYLAGHTTSTTNIASGGFQNTIGGNTDAFLVKFSSSGQRLWATYYGGSGSDYGNAVAVDKDGNAYMAGYTQSSSGIASGGFQNTFGGNSDAFLVRFSSSGQRLWATYYGGSGGDYGNAVAVDKDGNVYLAGETTSLDGIASGGFQNTFGGNLDAFLVKFSSTGQRLWATYYGGSGNDSGSGRDSGSSVAADKDGNVYLTGPTASSSGIASGGFQNTFGGNTDAFLVRFSSSGQRLWATYYGGSGGEYGSAVAVDKDGNVYLAGYTTSLDGIASGGFQNTFGGNFDAYLTKILDQVSVNFISGTLYNDVNANCIKDANEKPLPAIIVKAEPEGFGISDSLGNYSIPVNIGSYTVRQILPNKKGLTITQLCPNNPATYSVQFATYGNTVTGKDFANQVALCHFLQTSISSNRRRRCFLNNTSVSYSNSGFAKAENVKVYVKMPEYVVLKKADKTFTRDSEGNYVFSIGSLDINQSGIINIQDSVVCKTGITGLTACTKVWITPSNNCTPPKSTWDKSDVVLSGKCIDNGFVRIVLRNIGEGNMADSTQLRIFLDTKLALKRGFKLSKGDSLVVRIPANGRTVRLEADQRPDHPRKSQSNITFEGCVASLAEVVSKGFVNQLPQDDTEPEVSIDCQRIIDSFDPNDKQVSPIGTTAEHFTPTNAELQYLIRFQNTGSDTAYTVTVIDTLSDNLDIATLQIGASSHKYKFNVSGKGKPVLTWTFNNINLPDSTRNEKASNGFLSFSIKAKENLPLKTKIENFADIIFDFNYPVRTNKTFNVIYDVPADVVQSVKLDEKTIIILKPLLTSFSPSQAKVGESIILKGKYFDNNLTNNTVKVNGIKVNLDSGNDSTLVFKVPQGATSGKIKVENTAGFVISSTDLIIVYPPLITSFSPLKALVGEIVTLKGKNFDRNLTANTLTLNAITVTLQSGNDSTLVFKVPQGATSGKINVQNLSGSATSLTDLVVIYLPLITSFTPQTGVPGDKVTITGNYFEEDKTKNNVKFGTIQAEVIGSTSTTLEVKVPAGFYQEKISVTTTVGNVVSLNTFNMAPNALEIVSPDNISIFPNPTEGKVKIESEKVKLTKVLVLNALGQQVMEKKVVSSSGKEELDLTGKEKGLYFLVIYTSQTKLITKLLLH